MTNVRPFRNVKRDDPNDDNMQDDGAKGSAATLLVGLLNASITEAWHDEDGRGYVTIRVDGHLESHPVHSSMMRTVANGLFFREYQKAISSEAVKSALNTIEFAAIHTGPTHPIWYRIGHTKGVVWVDLGTPEWSAVRIDAQGWSIVPSEHVPLKFERTKATRPLPMPLATGKIDTLRRMFNMDDRDWFVVCAFLVAAFQPSGARAFLEIVGQSGSGKSSLLRFITALIDPVKTATRGAPKDEVDLIIATRGRAILGFDNVSSIHPDMLDAYCRLSTGGGIGKRELHTDGDEYIMDAQLPIIWTAIFPQGTSRADFRQRTMSVSLNTISQTTRYRESELDTVFKDIYPEITGAIYSIVSVALSAFDTMELEKTPRLSDFAHWIESAAPGIGMQPGEFLRIMEDDRRATEELVIESSPVGSAIVEIMKESPTDERRFTASELLSQINEKTSEAQKRQKGYPPDATRLSQQISRIAEALQVHNLFVKTIRTRNSRFIEIKRVPEDPPF